MPDFIVFADSPKFVCDEKMQAKLYEQYFNLTCRVHASPSVTDAKFHWTGDNDNDTLEVGEKSSDISANMTEGVSCTIYLISQWGLALKLVILWVLGISCFSALAATFA